MKSVSTNLSFIVSNRSHTLVAWWKKNENASVHVNALLDGYKIFMRVVCLSTCVLCVCVYLFQIDNLGSELLLEKTHGRTQFLDHVGILNVTSHQLPGWMSIQESQWHVGVHVYAHRVYASFRKGRLPVSPFQSPNILLRCCV
jgi:hypothetical protein